MNDRDLFYIAVGAVATWLILSWRKRSTSTTTGYRLPAASSSASSGCGCRTTPPNYGNYSQR